MSDRTREVAIGSVILILVLSGTIGYFIFEDEGRTAAPPDLIPLSRELSDLIAANLSSSGRMTDEEIVSNITSWLPEMASISPTGVKGYTVHVFDVSVHVHHFRRELPLTPPLVLDGASIGINSMLDRHPSGTIEVPGVRADITASVRLEPIDPGDRIFTTISISPEVIDASSATERMVDLLLDVVSGPGNELGRDVEYMLNALARVRAVNGYGWKNREGPANVLNQGDIELALNLALGMRMASLTGRLPEELVRSIDRYYTEQSASKSMNPTGFRPWGVSETRNFQVYAANAGPVDSRRDASSMLDSALERGGADPADMLARYLYIERLYTASAVRADFNPFDDQGALEEAKLVNARQDFDLIDASAVATTVAFQPEEGLEVISEGLGGNRTMLIPHLDLPGGYLVSARDFKVSGLVPTEWYTDVDLNRSAESLVNINITPAQTRCGGIVPPSKPPDHDFRMLWDLEIEGSFSVRGWTEMWRGNTVSSDRTERVLDLSFPARVMSWYETRPANDNHRFQPLYRTVILNTTDASGYLIPPEANATEFFEEYTFQSLRGLFAPLTALQRLALSYGEVSMHEMEAREAIQLASMEALREAHAWNVGLTSVELKNIVNLLPAYLNKGALVPYLKPMRVEGSDIDLEWSGFSDRLDLVSTSSSGTMVVSIEGLLAPPLSFSATIDPGTGTRIDLDLSDYDFTVTYRSEGGQYSEGPGSPKRPVEALMGLTLESTWEASSPPYVLKDGDGPGYPFVLVTRGGPTPLKTTINFIVRGGPEDDSAKAVEAASRSLVVGSLSLEDIVPAMLSSGDVWTGIRVRADMSDTTIVRTLWIRSSGTGAAALAQESWTYDLVGSLFPGRSYAGEPPSVSDVQIVMETAFSYGTTEITFYEHLTSEVPGIYAFQGVPGGNAGDWEVTDPIASSPLW